MSELIQMICKNCHNAYVKNPEGVSYYAVELCPVHAMTDRLAEALATIVSLTRDQLGNYRRLVEPLLAEYDAAKDRK